MTRGLLALSAVLLMLALVTADLFITPPNPYQQPPLVALGSGTASAGGFCGAMPGR